MDGRLRHEAHVRLALPPAAARVLELADELVAEPTTHLAKRSKRAEADEDMGEEDGDETL